MDYSLRNLQPEILSLPLKIVRQEQELKYGRRKSPIKKIIFHHTATASPKRTVRALLSGGASTHYEIDRDGTVYQYLDPARHVAWHCVGHNFDSIGIDLTHATSTPFTSAQMASAIRLLVDLCRQWDIAPTHDGGKHYRVSGGIVDLPLGTATVYGHGQLRPTQCPDGLDVGAIAGGAFRALSTRDL